MQKSFNSSNGSYSWKPGEEFPKDYNKTYTGHKHLMQEVLLGKYKIYASSAHNILTKASVRVYLDRKYLDEDVFVSSSKQAHILPLSATEIIYVPWADMSTPRMSHIQRVVDYVVSQIKKGRIVEVGCMGGHGRTGTFLACVAISLLRLSSKEAIERIRKNYCNSAIETKSQEEFIQDFEDCF